MKDKIKEFREEHPWLDAAAGFIPYVGEAQDIQDFTHAASKNDYGGMALASLGLLIPGFTGGHIKKLAKFGDDIINGGKKIEKIMDKPLPKGLKNANWTVAKDGAFVDPKGIRWIYYKGELKREDQIKDIMLSEKAKATQKVENKQKRTFKKDAEAFRIESKGLDFSLENWQSLAPGHKMTNIEKQIYTTQAFPKFVKSYRELTQKGKERLIKDEKTNKWYGWFDEPVADGISENLPILKQKWKKGWRELNGEVGAMTYVIVHSDQAKGKFLYNGITMHQGIPEIKEGKIAKKRFENGFQKFKKWFDSDISGAPEYSNPNNAKGGLQIFGLPIRPSLLYKDANDKTRIIKRMISNPSSTNWNGKGDPIGAFLGKNTEKGMYISEGSLIDDAATRSQHHPVKGIFTIVGEHIPIKSIFGGSGMYDIEGKNLYKPFMQFAAPIGLTSLMGYKAYDKTKK